MTKDLQDFREGQTVDISNIEAMQSVVITRISNSGATIVGKICGELIVSCKSPATLSAIQHEVTITVDPKTQRNIISITRVEDPAAIVEKRARPTDENDPMSNLMFPVNGPFTITQLAELNDLPYPKVAVYCRDYLIEAGTAPRKEGARGKASKLFKIA